MKTEERKMADQENLEQLLMRIDDIIEKMQEKEVSLEDSFHLYQQGIEAVKACNEKIDAVEKQLIILDEQGREESSDSGKEEF